MGPPPDCRYLIGVTISDWWTGLGLNQQDLEVQPTAVILVVGLNESLLAHCPAMQNFAERGAQIRLQPVLPAVTCAVQASMLTGTSPAEHGIVGNGWYDRELSDVQFWKQSNHLVRADKVWDAARRRDATFTVAKMFWWYNMYAAVDYAVTPRPIYKADGRKLPDVYAEPPELRERLQAELGTFPLFSFWGPGAAIASTRWIAEATLRVHQWHRPTLSLAYLPHLDYDLQRFGPDDPRSAAAAREVDTVVARMLEYFSGAGVRPIIVSEYGIEAVDRAATPNRALRRAGFLRVRVEEGLELLDAGASRAFTVCDHQIAHVYVRDSADIPAVRECLAALPEVDQVIPRVEQGLLAHARSGDLVLVARQGTWFSYHYWLDDARAPDFARCVDIHRKPGYDPCELFLDPLLFAPRLRIAWRLLQKRLGQRMLMDVIPLDNTLVRGSHGRVDLPDSLQPIMLTTSEVADGQPRMPCTAVHDVILRHVFDELA